MIGGFICNAGQRAARRVRHFRSAVGLKPTVLKAVIRREWGMDIGDWDNVRVFVAAAQSRSLRAAAAQLNISQPTVGRRISEFEARLGTTLLLRSRDGVTLTESGERVLAFAERMQATADRMLASVSESQEYRGVVRFCATDAICGYWLPPLLAELNVKYPEITVDVTVRDAGYVPDLTKMETDLTVVYTEPTDPDVAVIARGAMQMVFCASRSYINAYGMPRQFADIADHMVCIHSMHTRKTGLWDDFAEMLVTHPKVTYRTNSSISLGQAVRSGLGISLQPAAIIERETDIVFIEMCDFKPYSLPFWMVCHSDIKNIPRIRVVIEQIKKGIFKAQSQHGSMTRTLTNAV